MSTERPSELPAGPEQPESANAVAWAGLGFSLIALILYVGLQQMLIQLPATRAELDGLRTNAPALTRLMIVGAGAALMNLAGLVLCLVGYVAPGRSRLVAILGALVSALMLLGFFSIVLVSLMLGE